MSDTDERQMLRELWRSSAAMLSQLDEFERRLDRLEQRQEHIVSTLNRWKGAMPVLVAVGGVLAWVFSAWEGLRGLFKHTH